MKGQSLNCSRFVAAALLATLLAGCTMFSSSNDSPPTVESTSLAPGAMSATEIRTILQGKSWKWTGPNNTGTTLYAADGTSLVEVDGKGTTKGKWTTQDGKLCESFDPAPFLPGGVPMSCYDFSGSDGSYKAGKATFTQAS